MNVLAVISPGLKVLFERVGKPEVINRPDFFRLGGTGAVIACNHVGWADSLCKFHWTIEPVDTTHGPGSLSEGYIEGDVVECNFHNGQFNIKTGEVASPPCMIPVKTYRTVVEDGKVFIEV